MEGVDMTRSAGGRRNSYHHGNLRNALVAAATELARAGGPEAVVLRGAARRVGVSATAAYRHFDGHGDLLQAVREQAKEGLADAMEEAMREAVHPGDDAGEAARRKLRAIGWGYIRFALTEPGLFRTAFLHEEVPADLSPMEQVERYALTRPYQILGSALDDLVACGSLAQQRRPFADTACWASVHGLAVLLMDGPLAALPPKDRDAMIEGVFDISYIGLSRD